MLTRFSVKNYKCLADVSLPLTPIHVLIGQNDAGKTSLLEAMYGFFRSSELPLSEAFPGKWEGMDLVFHGPPDSEIEFSGEWDHTGSETGNADSPRYGFAIRFPGKRTQGRCAHEWLQLESGKKESLSSVGVNSTALWNRSNPRESDHPLQKELDAIEQLMRGAQMYRLDAKLMAVPAAISEQRKFRMDPDGFGLPSLLDDLLGYDPQVFINLSCEFCSFFPQFTKVRIEAERAVERRYNETGIHLASNAIGKGIFFETTGGKTVRAQQASDGAILFLGFLALAHLPKPPKLLLIEEPENGIYPKRLAEVVQMLKKLSASNEKTELPQIVITTHSPYLLSLFEPEEVTFLARQPDGSVGAHPLRDVRNLKERLDGFYLGELWYNLTEEELLSDVSN